MQSAIVAQYAGDQVVQFGMIFGAGFDRGDQFQVNVGVIPLPASLPLLFGALGALGYIARRRRTLAAA